MDGGRRRTITTTSIYISDKKRCSNYLNVNCYKIHTIGNSNCFEESQREFQNNKQQQQQKKKKNNKMEK